MADIPMFPEFIWKHNIMQIATKFKNLYFWLHLVLVVSRGLSCLVAREISAPQSAVEPVSTALESGMLITGPPRMSWQFNFERVMSRSSANTNYNITIKIILYWFKDRYDVNE